MKRLFITIAAFLVLMFQGCGLFTFYPIFTPADLLKDDRVLGSWESKDETAVFARASEAKNVEIPENLQAYKERFYTCTLLKEGEETEKYLAFLVKLGNTMYMDLFPLLTSKEKLQDEFFREHKLKLHTITRIEISPDKNSIRWLGYKTDYINDLIRNKKVRIKHDYYSNHSDPEPSQFIITASTKELRQFLLKYGSTSESYDETETETFKRINIE